ncbi:MAG: tyrosine-type recombinase/integrase [Bdellovibrionales bacterium]|nr:tyrosine-type recombinase/integrase [Bdellovibrionales bacterium]
MHNLDFILYGLLDKYLKYLKFSKSFSELTLKSYKTDLFQFFDQNVKKIHFSKLKNSAVLKKIEHNKLDKASSKQLQNLLKNKMNSRLSAWSSWSPATRNRKIASLKSFFKWLYLQGFIQEDINAKIKSPKVPSRIPHFLSVDEVKTLIQTCEDEQKKDPSLTKDLTLILMLYGGGLRVSEACSAKWKNLSFSDHTLKIRGKGSKERIIVLPQKVLKHLKRIQKKSGNIFGNLKERQAYDIVRNWGARAGLSKPISPHVLRHSYATHLLDSGSDLRVLQDLLGHRSLSATQKYTQIHLSKLSKTLKSSHPLSRKK